MPRQTRLPWYRRTLRWGQTNITEIDPERYDIDWWRKQWKRTRVQGIIVNAGGIVAYYPTAHPLHRRSPFLGNRDLFGDVIAAAREEGLAVLARMDCNRADETFYHAHPDWFACDAHGEPMRAGELFLSCIHGPYYQEYIPALLTEIARRYHPDGFADNSWSGMGRDCQCRCRHCTDRFLEFCGRDLPSGHDWNDPAYRAWIRWNYRRRLEVWDHFNRVTREAGGPDCLWIGMLHGDLAGQVRQFRDVKALAERSSMVLIDSQTRHDTTGFHANADTGKLLHGIAGWDTVMIESMAMYQSPGPIFRLCSRPQPEAHLWMTEGFAGGIHPWWHHIGAYHEDRRQYHTAAPLMRQHARNSRYLVNRQPVATAGIVWSQENADFFGRDDLETAVMQPYRGWINALVRARIPHIPVHADHIRREAGNLSVLILPNLGILTDDQCAAIREFSQSGGGVIASGETGLYNCEGERLPDYSLSDLFGIFRNGEPLCAQEPQNPAWDCWERHSYLRLHPQLRARVDGPHIPSEPPATGVRNPVLAGFNLTDILPFGGRLESVSAEEGTEVPLTWIPPFPIYPPETAWMREPVTTIPALILKTNGTGGRCACLAADLDRCFFRHNLPDHGRLLANLVHWTCRGKMPLQVEGAGLIDCNLYRQPGRMILHVVNLSGDGAWRAPMHEFVPAGPFRISVRLGGGVPGKTVRLLVSGNPVTPEWKKGEVVFTIPSVDCHEMVVIE